MTPMTTTETLKKEYQLYLDASFNNDIAAIQSFMSPSCWQLARQNPAWNLANRDEIMNILISMRNTDENPGDKLRGNVEIRALTQDERETIPEDQKAQSLMEGWEGLHVMLESPDTNGMRVEVIYYWRIEKGKWVQCFHDLLWLGPMEAGAENDIGASIFENR